MRPILVALSSILLLTLEPCARAEQVPIKPTDFEPLTSLPWKDGKKSLAEILSAIFREPDSDIRYPALAEYLRRIPVGQLSQAFDLSVELEGEQTPNSLVRFFLRIWAERDPVRCWERTRQLFKLVGIEGGWLNYDSWTTRSRITVQDLAAIRASSFWIESEALLDFPFGVEASSLPKPERVRVLKAFADLWFERFGSWPGTTKALGSGYSASWYHLLDMSNATVEHWRSWTSWTHPTSDFPSFEMALRCWMSASPGDAVEIINVVKAANWQIREGQALPPSDPSPALLMIWAKNDLPGMIRRVDTIDLRESTERWELAARGLLLSRVDEATRQRWLTEAKGRKTKDETEEPLRNLFQEWAKWDPSAALQAAADTGDEETLLEAFTGAADSPWYSHNARHFGFKAIKAFPLTSLPAPMKQGIRGDWSQMVLEAWGDIDIGDTARHGLQFILATDYVSRHELMAFFYGGGQFDDEGGAIDRTFCALRVWAVVKPNEMKSWIASLPDPEMSKALTWLLEHPWGFAPEQ